MTIILSEEKGIFQHDIYSWQVLKDDLVQLSQNTDISEDIDKTLTDWLEVTTSEQRKIVIDAVFELFYSTEANTFADMSKNFSNNLPKILKKYGEIAKEDKEIITNMIKIIVGTYINIFREREKNKLQAIKEDYAYRSKLKMDELNKKYMKFFKK